jgi:hypothetical protein
VLETCDDATLATVTYDFALHAGVPACAWLEE